MQNDFTPPADTQKFPCQSCGAYLVFKPGSSHLTCHYCGSDNVIDASDAAIEELDFDNYLAAGLAAAEKQQVAVVKCSSCGAQSSLKPQVTSDNCPFCGTALVVSTGSLCDTLKPKSLLPFKIEQKKGFDLFRGWIKSLWFAPNGLKRMAENHERLTGMYIPYWTYDCQTDTNYTGERGDDYYVNETYTAVENGRSVTRTRQVRKTRWTHAAGEVHNHFDDVLVIGSHSLPGNYAQALEPWELKELVPFNEKFLSGFRTESYQVDVKQGFEVAKGIMEGMIRSTVCQDIGGDHQRIHAMNVRYKQITFKHVLLPIWLSAYRYNGKVYRFMVNGCTGEVQGERPWSWVKIALAILAVLAVIGFFFYLKESTQ